MKSWRRHRWIALLALFGLLFQQTAMAAYVCPLERQGGQGVVAGVDHAPPCHTRGTLDRVRCHEHCSPTASAVSAKPVPDVDAPQLAVQTWPPFDAWVRAPRLGWSRPDSPQTSTATALIVRFCRRLE